MKYSLPDSAEDLLIKDGKLLMRSLSVYEVLRRFGHIIRLTPFRFEDFTAALLAEEQSSLIAEIHIQLLRTLMREDRQQQTWLGPPDLRDSVNVYLHLADHANWPAALRIYLSADTKGNSSILDKLAGDGHKNYPFNVNLPVKLDVLEQLCDQFLLSNLAREEIVNGSNSIGKHDNVCRLCSKPNGHLVPCGNCPAVYHLKCSDPPLENYPDLESGDKTYLCAVCRSNHIIGVSDCTDPDDNNGNLKRHGVLGMDKLGRRYWFLVRRLFVVDETEDDVRYYTKLNQFKEIVENLNENRYEKSLIDNLQEQREEIERQMKITEDLYKSLLKDHKNEDGSYSQFLGQDGTYKNYINQYSSSNLAIGKNQHSDRDINRSLSNKFSVNSLSSFKWYGAINGYLASLTVTIKSTILKFEAMLPQTFIHPCWQSQKSSWIKSVNYAHGPADYAIALSQLEASIKPILFKSAWYDSVGFSQLFRSTFTEREELKKTDRQPRGFERREWFSQDFELSYRLGTMVKFSPRLKPVKHQVWKQKGEEYRLTGLNGWYWRSRTFKSRLKSKSVKTEPYDGWLTINKSQPQEQLVKKCVLAKPQLPPCHNFLTKRSKMRTILLLPDVELRKLARSGGMKEAKSFSYTAKQNNYVWPYGMTPRPTFRTCWLYKNRVINTIQDVALQLKVIYACIRWDDLQVRPPASGHNVIVTDEATVTIELLKKRDKLPYLTHSEYLIKKVVTPIEQPTKYRKIGSKKSTPSARSGLRARRQTEEEGGKGPTTEEVWVPEEQLELWELKQFDEKLERQNQLIRERALREEAERRRKIEEEKRRKADQERRRRVEEEAKKTKLAQASLNVNASTPSTPQAPKQNNNATTTQQRSLPSTPVLRYFRTEQGQIIRLPASYLQRGTPLILRHVGPGPNQTNTYIIRPQITPVTTNIVVNASNTSTTHATPATSVPSTAPASSTSPATSAISGTPATSTTLATSTISTSPVTPAIAGTPATSTTLATSTISTSPVTPAIAGTPVTSTTLATSTISTSPVTPAIAGTPVTSTTLATSTISTSPATPAIYATPAISAPSIAPATPAISVTPATSTTSVTPTTSATPALLATYTLATSNITLAIPSAPKPTTTASNPVTTTPNAETAQSASAQQSVGTVVNEMAHDQHAPAT